MSLNIIETEIEGVVLIEPAVFNDPRGFFMETFHQKKYADAGIGSTFVQDNYSRSAKGTLRGLHYQLENPQSKLVYVIKGAIFDVVVDIRKGSTTFGKWVGAELTDGNRRQIYVPEGFAHGFCVLSETADVMYKCTDLYAPGDEYGVLWSDPEIGINWPIKEPLLSDKDRICPALKDVPEDDLPVYQG